MFKHTLVLSVVIVLAASSSSFAQKRSGFSLGGSSKNSISQGNQSANSGGSNFSSNLRKSTGSSLKFNSNSNGNSQHRINTNTIHGNIQHNFHNQIKKNDHTQQLHGGTFNTHNIKFNSPVQKLDSKFNHHVTKQFDIKKNLIQHHGNVIQPICPPKVDCHKKPICHPHVNVWWGCHKPVHCHTVIKVPCHRPVVQEVIIEEPLVQVMVNTTIQLETAGLSPEAGQLIVQMDQLSIPAELVEWTPIQAKVTIPMMNLTGPMKATLHLVNADGSLAQSINVELIPFNEAALAAIAQ